MTIQYDRLMQCIRCSIKVLQQHRMTGLTASAASPQQLPDRLSRSSDVFSASSVESFSYRFSGNFTQISRFRKQQLADTTCRTACNAAVQQCVHVQSTWCWCGGSGRSLLLCGTCAQRLAETNSKRTHSPGLLKNIRDCRGWQAALCFQSAACQVPTLHNAVGRHPLSLSEDSLAVASATTAQCWSDARQGSWHAAAAAGLVTVVLPGLAGG